MIRDIENSATALYDGGWRHDDREEIKSEYELTPDEADELCKALEKIEIDNMTEEEKEIAIIMSDRSAESEAKSALARGTIVYSAEDYEKDFDYYNRDYDLEDEDDAKTVEAHRRMVETGDPAPDWGVTFWNGKKYYIMYVL